MSIFGSMEFQSNMISFSRSQPETFVPEPINSRKPSRETLDFQFGRNMEDNPVTLDFQFGQSMENNSETLKDTLSTETQSPLFDESFFNLNATPLTTRHPENSMPKTDNPVDDGNLQTPTTVSTDPIANESTAKSKSSKKPRKRGTKESKVKIGLIEGPDLPDWLPEGWQLERKKRENGVNTGMVETFYYDPEKGRQFRSKSEVLLFLESGTRRKRKSYQRRAKQILAEPTDNYSTPTQARATTSKSYIDNQPYVSSIDANGSGNLNPVTDYEDKDKSDNMEDGVLQTPATPTVAIESLAKSNSVKSWRRSGAVGTSLKLGVIEGADLPEWLPQGWKMERKVRQNGASAGMIDVVYTDPEKGRKFWSKVGVLRYLGTGTGRIRPKRLKPSNPSTRRRPSSKRRKTALMPDFTDQAEFGSEAQKLDADGFGSLNPLVDGETETEQTVHDWDADFTIAEVVDPGVLTGR
ncbi:hypothetical protein C5167_002960 [Papaver somniferum]|uniref:MBD domain-containing protein n=1 Tax=Papaver somniferum TaxID=3469 RepID=A0A4Y7KZN5_PAPSO|nr:hypothetical protein C5167_002960 [Papaver somniferum]